MLTELGRTTYCALRKKMRAASVRTLSLIALAGWLAGCSLLVRFDPETQPCDTLSLCLPGYACSDAGLCKSTDAGFIDASVGTASETACADGLDDDGDGRTDCADPDCAGHSCDDRDACTTGEACSNGTCTRGNLTICNTPLTPCQESNGTCEASSGQCLYAPLADGASCGAGQAARCCAGTCIDTAVNPAHCGGCGLACNTVERCQALDQSGCAIPEPANTSARCSCDGGASCPGGQVCSPSGVCLPPSNDRCAPGQSAADAGLCGSFCSY